MQSSEQCSLGWPHLAQPNMSEQLLSGEGAGQYKYKILDGQYAAGGEITGSVSDPPVVVTVIVTGFKAI